ncbi:MAG: DUF6671 family protein [Flavobacteriales bacterium]
MNSLFSGRTLLVATMHGREKVIAPVLEPFLGVKCVVPVAFDSDQFGTFSGEIQRLKSPLETLREKCRAALENTSADLILASEGSFGAHPYLPFTVANEEVLILMDLKNGLEIVAKKLSTETNFEGRWISSEEELREMMDRIDFPSHRLILKDAENHAKVILKNATDLDEIMRQFHFIKHQNERVYVETDMRAMNNPMRMRVIEQATHQLLAKIHVCCPACHAPGFDVVAHVPGLPCQVCAFPTAAILSRQFKCQKCQFEKVENRADGKKMEDPMFCPMCNP